MRKIVTLISMLIILLCLPVNLKSDGLWEESSSILRLRESCLWRGINDMIVRDTLIYAIYNSGLAILDPDPGFLAIDTVEMLPLEHAYRSAFELPNELMLYDKSGHIAFAFIKNPRRPFLTGACDLGQEFLDAAYGSVKLYLACGFGGVKIYDVGHRDNPILENTLREPSHTVAVWLYENYLYAVDDYNGLFIYDICDKQNPRFLGKRLFEKQLKDLVTVASTAWCANSEGGLVLLDLSDPVNPQFIGSYETRTNINAVDYSGGYIFASDVYGNFEIYDPEDSDNPAYLYHKYLKSVPEIISDNTGNYLTAADSSGVGHIYRQQSGWNLQDIYALGGGDEFGEMESIGNIAYISAGTSPLAMLTVPDFPGETPVSFLPAKVDDITFSDRYLYMLDNNNHSVRVMEVQNPEFPRDLSSLPYEGKAVDVDAGVDSEGNPFVVICFSDSAFVWSLDSDRSTITSRSTLGNLSEISGCHIYDHCLYVSHGCNLSLYDLSPASAPEFLDELAWPGRIYSFLVRGEKLYTSGDFGIQINDLDGPYPVSSSGLYSDDYKVYNIEMFDTLALCAAGEDGILILSINPDDDIKLLEKVETPGLVRDLKIIDSALVVSDGSGILIYDISLTGQFPSQPQGPNPDKFSLSQNYPNPFNQATLIAVEVPSSANGARLQIDIYNLLGQKVRMLADQETLPGRYYFRWDGKDDNGGELGSGLYFYRCRVGGIEESHKMLLLK